MHACVCVHARVFVALACLYNIYEVIILSKWVYHIKEKIPIVFGGGLRSLEVTSRYILKTL